MGPTSVPGTPEAPLDHIALAGLIIGSLVNVGKKVSCHFEFKLSYNNVPNKFELLDGINNVLFFLCYRRIHLRSYLVRSQDEEESCA